MKMADEKVTYFADQIKKIAPGYKGKPENFDPAKVGKRTVFNPKSKETRSLTIPPPTHAVHPPTEQRNESIISEAIFGIDVSVTEIAPRQSFSANYSKLIDIAVETYDGYRPDEKELERVFVREEMSYYATALLHLKLIEVKAKQGNEGLTPQEKDLRKATAHEQFNVPQPIATYLKEIGTYTDKMGKETRLEIPPLPITVVQNMGGYHAAAINIDTHNVFEEIPSLGIAGDMVMALALEDDEVPNFHIGKPEGTRFTTNLIGTFNPIGQRRPEIKQRLASYGITANNFAEYVPATRFNLRYIRSLSDIIGKLETCRIEKITMKNLGLAGGESQVIKTQPKDIGEREDWRSRSVQGTAATNSTAMLGAANCFGFQLYKEDGTGENRAARTNNWSCITPTAPDTWVMPDAWYANRNQRRNLPAGISTERFRAISLRQDLTLANVVRRMIKTQR